MVGFHPTDPGSSPGMGTSPIGYGNKPHRVWEQAPSISQTATTVNYYSKQQVTNELVL